MESFHNNFHGILFCILNGKDNKEAGTIYFEVKDWKEKAEIIIMEGFHQKIMEVMVDNGLRAVQRSKSLVIEKSKLACTALASMFPTFSFATSLISRISKCQ